VLTFFGLIHGEAIGVGSSPTVAVGYLLVAALLFVCAKYAEFAPRPVELHAEGEATPAE